jgi:hypothetical protein
MCLYRISMRTSTSMDVSTMRTCATYAHGCVDVCARVSACFGAHVSAPNLRALSVGVDRMRLGSQVFSGAYAFNQNLAAWNVVRVTSLEYAFSHTALAGCNQYKLYVAWGATLRAAFPTFATAACTAVAPMNIPVSSAATVTIRGVGFSSIDLSPSAFLSGQPCRTTTWTTATQLVCAAPSPVLATGARRARPIRPSHGRLTTVGRCRRKFRDVGQGCRNYRVRGLYLRRCATALSLDMPQ